MEIIRSQVHIISPGAFVRAGKGTVIRKLSEEKLRIEADELYLEEKPRISLKLNIERSTIETFVGYVAMDAFSRKIGAHDEFFAFGLDSLKSTAMIRNLKASIKPLADVSSLGWISFELLYRYASISELSEVLFLFLTSATVRSPSSKQLSEEITAMITEYTKDFPKCSFTDMKDF
ncbi:hypothetical protein MMC14_010631 [Varicellaria rhodocarpa]|nr:hypothetical protein [Varicellaria rhodocarpa]